LEVIILVFSFYIFQIIFTIIVLKNKLITNTIYLNVLLLLLLLLS